MDERNGLGLEAHFPGGTKFQQQSIVGIQCGTSAVGTVPARQYVTLPSRPACVTAGLPHFLCRSTPFMFQGQPLLQDPL